MTEENGMPKLGQSATTLGIRTGKDIVPDNMGMVHRPNFDPGMANGLSCAPSIGDLPRFVLPVSWGGLNKHTVVWKIAVADLASELIAQQDSAKNARRKHVSLGPSSTMSMADFEAAIEATRSKWKKVVKP
jgi:hypothetical protein